MRRPAQSEEAKQGDVMYLTRCMRRIQLDPNRPDKQKAELVGHLKAVIAALMTDDVRPKRRTA